MTDTTREALLADVLRWSGIADRVQPGEVIASDIMIEKGVSHQTAKRALDKLVDEGRLTKRAARDSDGRPVTAYRKTGE